MERSERIKEKVLFLLDAINFEDYESAKECLNYDFRFQEFLLTFNNSQKFLDRMKRLQTKFKIKKIFADDQHVCVFYDLKIHPDNVMSGCGLFEFDNEKIVSLRQFTDPIKEVTFSEDGTS